MWRHLPEVEDFVDAFSRTPQVLGYYYRTPISPLTQLCSSITPRSDRFASGGSGRGVNLAFYDGDIEDHPGLRIVTQWGTYLLNKP